MTNQIYSRRDVLRALALGGAVVAGELWIPGQRVISIPTITPLSGAEIIARQRYGQISYIGICEKVQRIMNEYLSKHLEAIAEAYAVPCSAVKMEVSEGDYGNRIDVGVKIITPRELYREQYQGQFIGEIQDEQILPRQADSELLPARSGVQS